MSSDASTVLGAQELAGCFVSPKGLTKQITGATAAGMVAGIAGTVGANRALAPSGAPDFGRVGYVVATADEIAIVKAKTGAFKPKIGTEVVARTARSQVSQVGLDAHALTATLTIAFADGNAWQFEVPKVHRAGAQHLTQVLSAPVA